MTQQDNVDLSLKQHLVIKKDYKIHVSQSRIHGKGVNEEKDNSDDETRKRTDVMDEVKWKQLGGRLLTTT